MEIFKYFVIVFFISSCANPVNNFDPTLDENSVIEVYSTCKNNSNRLSNIRSVEFRKLGATYGEVSTVYVNKSKVFQEIVGIGGSVTDASAYLYSKLNYELKKELLESYFSTERGIGYTILKTPIHSNEFSRESYTYINGKDSILESFSIKRDLKERIPLLQSILNSSSRDIKILASPSSPPAFMKNNNSLYNGGKLLPKYYFSWANYYTKFIEEYENAGVPIWGVSLQNDPMTIKKSESCIYNPEEEYSFLKNYLGPVMEEKGRSERIIVGNHSQALMMRRADVLLKNDITSKYIWGVGYQEDYEGNIKRDYGIVDELKESYPSFQVINTQFSIPDFKKEDIYSWTNAELYGESMLDNFKNGSSAFIDWNILLDVNGGPNHIDRKYFSPIHADIVNQKLMISPSYYFIGHFSKFIQSGARRISSSSSKIKSVAFENPNGSIIVVTINKQEENISYKLIVDGLEARLNIEARSIQTLVF